MMLEDLDFPKNRTVVTTVSMPINLYIQLIERARSKRVSLSEIVRQALFREFEKGKRQKDSDEES